MVPFIPNHAKALPSSEELLLFLTPEGVLYLVMNRPEVSNAFNGAQMQNIIEVLEDAANDPEVKVVILTGNEKNFCAGGDISYMKRLGENSFEENKEDALLMAQLMFSLHEFPKPTLARVNGAAYGGGVGLVCCCDMAFGTEKTKLCLSEVKIGMVPATIGPYINKALGTRNAHRYMLSAEVVTGQNAVDAHFLSDIFPENTFDEDLYQLAKKIAQHGPQALQTTKAILLNVAPHQVDDGIIDYTAEVIANIRSSEEGKEGLSAFLEKRKPNFK